PFSHAIAIMLCQLRKSWHIFSIFPSLLEYVTLSSKFCGSSFFQSWASLPMVLITVTVMGVGIYLPFSPIAASLGFIPLPGVYFLWLALILTCYCVLTQFVKTWFIKKYGYT
ncbi:hypothetical protein G7B40_034880, partial [Aetokthonos hydrillicola Thurmond2011]|nr:hypothetical protein [Aetokthonos hydrillicola Thurmond2011]